MSPANDVCTVGKLQVTISRYIVCLTVCGRPEYRRKYLDKYNRTGETKNTQEGMGKMAQVCGSKARAYAWAQNRTEKTTNNRPTQEGMSEMAYMEQSPINTVHNAWMNSALF